MSLINGIHESQTLWDDKILKKEILEYLQRCLAKYYCWVLLVGQIRRM